MDWKKASPFLWELIQYLLLFIVLWLWFSEYVVLDKSGCFVAAMSICILLVLKFIPDLGFLIKVLLDYLSKDTVSVTGVYVDQVITTVRDLLTQRSPSGTKHTHYFKIYVEQGNNEYELTAAEHYHFQESVTYEFIVGKRSHVILEYKESIK